MNPYLIWNRRLFEYFFNEDNIDSPVICYVDEGVIEEVGKDLGGRDGFIKSVVTVNGYPQHLGRIFGTLVCSKDDCNNSQEKTPPFFGLLCLSILACTVNEELHSGNYYGRLNSILSPVYKGMGEEFEEYHVGEGKNQSATRTFYRLLQEGFELLEYHTIEHLNADLGFWEFRKFGKDYVDIPRTQALINAMDRSGLERFFAEQGVQPGDEISHDEAKNLIDPLALHVDYLRQATINHWNDNQTYQDIICEIVISLVKHWDGEYEELNQHEQRGQRNSPKRSGAYLVPSLRINTWGENELEFRVEFTSQDCPISHITLKGLSGDVLTSRQHGGWTRSFAIPEVDLQGLLSAKTTQVLRLTDGTRVRFFPKPIFIFEKNLRLGGYTPTKLATENKPCLVLAHRIEATTFLEANQTRLEGVFFQPRINGWELFDATSQGLKSLDGVQNLFSIFEVKRYELYGGAVIGRGGKSFSEIVPPQVYVPGQIPDGCCLVCRRGLDVAEMTEGEDSLFDIPIGILKTGKYEAYLADSNGEKLDKPLIFRLVGSGMPGSEEITSCFQPASRFQEEDFLYNTDDFIISIEGGTALGHKEHAFLHSREKDFLSITASHRLSSLTVLCDEMELELINDDLGQLCSFLPPLEDGKHTICALWHGLQICRKEFVLLPRPSCHIEVHGAIQANKEGTEWFSRDSSEVKLEINVKQAQEDGQKVLVFINENKEYIRGGFYTVKLPSPGEHKVELRWSGLTLVKKNLLVNPTPEILVGLEKATGEKWKGSQIYNPLLPPSFEVLYDENDFSSVQNIRFFLEEVELIRDFDVDGIIRMDLPENHTARGMELKLHAEICDDQFPLDHSLAISICDKPSCNISFEGLEIRTGVYPYDLPPKILLSNKKDNLSLYIDGEELKPLKKGTYCFRPAHTLMSETEERSIIQVKWWSEIIEVKEICFTRRGKDHIEFMGGEPIAKKGRRVYMHDFCPEQVKVELEGSSDPYQIFFGQEGTKLSVLTREEGNVFSLGTYRPECGLTYIVEIKQGDIKLDSQRFLIAGKDWLKLGYREGLIAPLNLDSKWTACWFVEKKGKRPPQPYLAGNCPRNVEMCPCDNVKQEKEIIPSKNDVTKWKDIVRRARLKVFGQDQIRWGEFTKRRAK